MGARLLGVFCAFAASAGLAGAPPAQSPGDLAAALQHRYDTVKSFSADVVDLSSLEIRGLVTVDAQGGESRFSFANLKENADVADKEFAFKMPRGVDVVKASPRE